MRPMLLGLLASAFLLAGCSGPAPAEAAAGASPVQERQGTAEAASVVADEWNGATSIELLSGTAAWHDEAAPDNLGFMALQSAFGYCEFGDREVNSFQFQVSRHFPHGGVLNGTEAFVVTADWADQDHAGEALRFVGFSPGEEPRAFHAVLPRGEPIRVDLQAMPDAVAGVWDLWLCTYPQAPPSLPPVLETAFPFLGEVSVKVEMARQS